METEGSGGVLLKKSNFRKILLALEGVWDFNPNPLAGVAEWQTQ
jgi:hypothetical protein